MGCSGRSRTHELSFSQSRPRVGPAELIALRGTVLAQNSAGQPFGNAILGAKIVYITRGSRWENGFNESFNARLRDKLLDGQRLNARGCTTHKD